MLRLLVALISLGVLALKVPLPLDIVGTAFVLFIVVVLGLWIIRRRPRGGR